MLDVKDVEKEYGKIICFGCDHLSGNSLEFFGNGCRAFPDGIPLKIIGKPHSHDKIIEGQVGDFVYTRAKYEYDSNGDKIEIYQ